MPHSFSSVFLGCRKAVLNSRTEIKIIFSKW
jgi:hypothetical protein